MNHWNQKEVEKAAKIYVEAEKRKRVSIRLLDEAIHWLIFLLIVFGNFILTVFLLFSSLFWGTALFYVFIVLVALGFGWLIDLPIRDLEKLNKHKHLLSRLLLPLLALVNVYFFIGMKNFLQSILGITVTVDSIFAGLVYGVCFLLPHGFMHRRR